MVFLHNYFVCRDFASAFGTDGLCREVDCLVRMNSHTLPLCLISSSSKVTKTVYPIICQIVNVIPHQFISRKVRNSPPSLLKIGNYYLKQLAVGAWARGLAAASRSPNLIASRQAHVLSSSWQVFKLTSLQLPTTHTRSHSHNSLSLGNLSTVQLGNL